MGDINPTQLKTYNLLFQHSRNYVKEFNIKYFLRVHSASSVSLVVKLLKHDKRRRKEHERNIF